MVGCLEHVVFHNIWDVILPIDELIFFKMVIAPPSRHGEKNTDDCWITWDVFTNPIIDDEGESSPKLFQWEFQDPKMEVPTIYKAYIRPI